jgi:CubicO group peptidase (beta-lactamase class C family)
VISLFVREKPIYIVCLIIVLILSCSPRTTKWGLPQHDYTYQAPEKIGDGWECSDLKTEGVGPKKISELMWNILKGDIKNIHSILLVKNGKLIFEEYFYGYNRDKSHYLASVTKSVASALIGIAMDQNYIEGISQGGLDKTVLELFPEYGNVIRSDAEKENLLFRHILSMTAGIDWDEQTFSYLNPLNDMYRARISNDSIRYLLKKPVVAEPGTVFNYNSMLSVMLTRIIAKSSGMLTNEFAELYLFNPLGIDNYSWDRLEDGVLDAAGGLHMRPRDMAKIGYLFLNEGKWKGKQIISKEWITESARAHATHDLGYGYGYQWRSVTTTISNQKIDVFWASGHGGQRIFVIPTLDLVAVFTSKVFDNPLGGFRPAGILKHYIIPSMLPPVPPRKTIKLGQNALDRYVGKYQLRFSNVPLIIFRKEDKLFVPTPDREFVELFPESEHRFFGISKEFGDAQLDFVKEEKGNIQKVVVHMGFGRIQCEKIE